MVFDGKFSFNNEQKDPEKVERQVSVIQEQYGLDFATGEVSENADQLQRRLGNRQIQLLAIGGTIGTALFVSIGSGLHYAGPAGLFMGYLLHAIFIGLVNNCIGK